MCSFLVCFCFILSVISFLLSIFFLVSIFFSYFFFFLRIRRPPRSTRTDTLFPYTTLFRSTLQAMLKAIPASGEIATFPFGGQLQANGWGISAAHCKPLGWTIVAAVPNDDLTQPAIKLRNRLAAIFLAILLISLIVAWALSARITRPLQQLSLFARKLPEQDLSAAADIPDHITQLPSKQPDEVGRLASTFIFMDQQLREKVARLVLETSSRERLESELSIAHDIQMGLLPVDRKSTRLNSRHYCAPRTPPP